MSSSNIKQHMLRHEDSQEPSDHAIEALRMATQAEQAQLGDDNSHLQAHSGLGPLRLQQTHSEITLHSRDHNGIDKSASSYTPTLTEFDLKSKDSKYKRWSPRMDQYLIKLLSDVVHSYPRGTEATMTKKAWAYVTGQLRAANPETVYSTYTKYSCQQHLYNVNHHRYKIWYILMIHAKSNQGSTEYHYRWGPDQGRFEIVSNTTGNVLKDERQIKSLLYSDNVSLPSLSSFNKGNLIVNDFFLTDNLKYMSLYHNEVLPLLMRLDSRYTEGLGDVYSIIPPFEYSESNEEYFRPLVSPRSYKITSNHKNKRRMLMQPHSLGERNDVLLFLNAIESIANDSPGNEIVDDSVDPALKRSKDAEANSTSNSPDFDNALVNAAIAAMNSPPVLNGRDIQPIYVKNRKWFNKLISLHDLGHLATSEILAVSEGVRDRKIPLFMLNILDQTYYVARDGEEVGDTFENASDEVTAKRVRDFMLPLIYNN